VGTTRLGDDGGKLFELSLGAEKCTQPLLAQFSGFLILAVSEQFHNTTLIRSISSNLSDDGMDQGALGRADALSVAGLSSTGDGGGGVALVGSSREVSASHRQRETEN